MTLLLLTLCLGPQCHTQRHALDVSPLGCLIAGQEIAAAWVSEHPGWRLAGVRCESGGGGGA